MDIIRAAGGLHRFINWPLPILTDSGGFQVFSLAQIRKIQAHGVEFRSHLDGSLLFLGPREAMAIQRDLGSDIAMVFDDCPPHTATPRELRAAVDRTVRWARECREQPRAPGQLVFGIVQGGSNAAIREECAKALIAMQFDGYAIGGVSVGEPEPEMMRAIEMTEPFLPPQQPRCLLPADLYPHGRPTSRAPYPWEIEHRERKKIARECVAAGLCGPDVDRAIELTLFARAFERWAEEGFPV